MAYKTMLRQLISKWGIMSIDLQNAFENDMTFTDENGKVNYVEEDADVIDIPEAHETQCEKTESSEGTATDAKSALFGK